MSKQQLVRAAGVIVLGAALGGVALATPGSGIVSAPIVAWGTFQETVDLKLKVGDNPNGVIHVPGAQDTVMQQVTIAPGGHTGWHSHPGPVVVIIVSGTLTFYDGDDASCSPRTYSVGDAFVDSGQGHVHIARNEGSTNLVLWATYFDVPPGGPFRIDHPDPGNCSF